MVVSAVQGHRIGVQAEVFGQMAAVAFTNLLEIYATSALREELYPEQSHTRIAAALECYFGLTLITLGFPTENSSCSMFIRTSRAVFF